MTRASDIRPSRLGALIALLVLVIAVPRFARPEAASLRPMEWGDIGARGSTHAPYESRDCTVCHARNSADPGPVQHKGDALCFTCHEEVKQHAHGFRNCTRCHNPHDSANKKLLRASLEDCRSCHRW